MDDFRVAILGELKSINRKLERLEENLEGKVRQLEHDIHQDLGPIKKHVTQVKFASVLIPTLITLVGVVSRLIP